MIYFCQKCEIAKDSRSSLASERDSFEKCE